MTGELRVAVAEDIDEIGPRRWPPLPDPPSLYLTHAWLRSVQGVLSPRSSYVTVQEGSGGRPLAALPCSLIEDPATYTYFNPARQLLDPRRCRRLQRFLPPDPGPRLAELAEQLARRDYFGCPALLAVAPYGYVCGAAWSDGVAADGRGRLIAGLLDGFADLSDRLGARTRALWYVHAGATPELERQALACGYRPVMLGAECRLDVRWPDFEGYLAALPAGRRKAARQEMRRFQLAGLEVTVEGPEALGQELALLQSAHRRQHGHGGSLERVHLGYRRATENLGPAIRVFVARRAGEAAGFLMAYEHAGSLYCKQVGFDRAAGEFVYFNVTFYAPIRYAIEAGLRCVQLGMESYEAKLRRGCRLVPVLGYVHGADELACRHLDLYDRAQRAAADSLAELYGAAAG